MIAKDRVHVWILVCKSEQLSLQDVSMSTSNAQKYDINLTIDKCNY